MRVPRSVGMAMAAAANSNASNSVSRGRQGPPRAPQIQAPVRPSIVLDARPPALPITQHGDRDRVSNVEPGSRVSSMGDFVGPNRQHAVERFRRRITTYQHRQQDTAARFQAGYPDLYEQQRQETELLRQRWLENSAKKSAKQSKVKDGGSGGQGAAIAQNNHRNLVTHKLKEKIDAAANGDTNIPAPPTSTPSSAGNVYNFHDDQQQQQQPNNQTTTDGSSAKLTHSGSGGTNISSSANVGVTGGGQDGSLPHLSVQIVQQISSERKSPQTIHTNVTVQSFPSASASNPRQPQPENASAAPGNNSNNISVHTSTSTHSGSYKTATDHPPSHTGSTPTSGASTGLGATCDSVSNSEANTSSNVECKLEQGGQDPFDALLDSLGSEVPELSVDELSDILGYIEKGDLERQLNTFDKVFKNVVQADRNEGSDTSSVFSSLDGQPSPGLSKATAPLVEAGHTSTHPPTATYPVTASQTITSTPPITASQTLTASQSITVHAPSQPHTVRAPSKPHKTSPAGGPSTALSPPTMFEAAQAMGGMTGPARFPVQSPPTLAEPTGPAAETLKQMAAQHQHQSSAGSPRFPGKTLPETLYNDNFELLTHKRSNFPSAYPSPSYPPSGANGAGGYPGYGPSPGFMDSAGTVPLGINPGLKPDLSGAGFNQTKPLTHFPGDGHSALPSPAANLNGQPSVPSSLQQLQKQVASQFSPPVQITQTQSVQMMQGGQRLHLSQTQQVQMAAAAAAAQQQQHMQQQGVPQGMAGSHPKTYSMSPQMPGQGQTAAPMGASAAQATREMQMMQEKIRLGQQHQHQYMSRPPPEYKIHSARAAAAPYPTPNMAGHNSGGVGHSSGAVRPGSGGVITPLQTMQNMVNQTPPYPGLKTETASGSATVMTQISAVQSMAMSVNGKGSHSGTTLAQASQNMTAYQQTVSQQQPLIHRTPSYSPHTRTPTPNSLTTPGSSSVSVNGGVGMGANSAVSIPHSVSASANPQTSNHNYTSALMRNQRPPNVNVGPDGLNISQPRVHPSHAGHMTHTTHPHPHTEGWPKSMMQGAHGAGHLAHNPQAMQGQLAMGAMPGQVGSGGHPAMPGQLTRGGHQGMQGQLVVGMHQSMQAQIGGRVAMASSPVNPMGQGAMMPSGYSHRPGSAGSAMGGSGTMPEHSMMGGGGMGMNGAIPPSIDFPPIVPQDFYYT